MKVTVAVRIDRDKLDQLIADTPHRVEQLIDVTAFNIQRSAAIYAPVLTGFLRSTIHVVQAGKYTRIVADGTDYGYIREVGIRGPAQPFMTPAAEEHRPAFNAALKELVEP